jgi:hypothetical protein
MGTDALAERMGQGKRKTLQASLIDFCFFSANPSKLGSSAPIRAIRGYFPSNRAAPVRS